MRRKRVVTGVLLACLLWIQPVGVGAQTGGDDAGGEQFGSTKFFDYAMCGASIVFASGTGMWVLAIITCGKAMSEQWTT